MELVQVYKYDEEGFYKEPIMIRKGSELPPMTTDQELPQPNYKPKFDGVQWVETLTEEEIEAIKNAPRPKTDEERLSLVESALDELLLGGL